MKPRTITLFEHDARGEFARWGLAAGLVLAAHVGLAASYFLFRNPQPAGMPYAPPVILELAPLPVASASEVDVAVGPQMRESLVQPEPPKVEQIEPPPPVQNPVVATLEPPKAEPKQEKKPPAPRTTAAPRNLTHTASVPAAPAAGSASAHNFPPSWINQLFSHLLRYRQYPSSAQANRQEGVVMLSFTMDRHGHVLSRYIAHSSGVPALDTEALAMIERAQPLPAFPLEMTDATRSFNAPIKFSLR